MSPQSPQSHSNAPIGRSTLLLLIATFLTSFGMMMTARAVEHVFPSDSGVVNVKTDLVSRGIHTSNAAGNGTTDDRAAIQAAINWALGEGRYSTAQMLYFPNGTYLISDTIQSRVATGGFSAGWRAGMILIGQSRAGTIIKLQDNANGFTDVSSRKSLIITGSENPNNSSEASDGSGNEAFRHQIHNLTVDVGSGNVGAVAIDFNVSNRGGIKDVLIKSSDTSKRGLIGLELRKNGDGVGPLLIKNVEIDGFTTGIQGQNSTFSSTFENITLKNQITRGVSPGQSMFTFRNLISQNSVPVINASSNIAHVTVIGGTFSGGAPGNSAVINSGKLLLRDITSSGYGKIVDNNSGGASDVTGGGLGEFTSHPVETLFGNAATTTLRLPVEETPTYENNNFGEWANVEDFGATKTNPDDGGNASNDDRAAIQAAIDSGAKVVYFPLGTYHVAGQIIIRGNVRKLIGFESALRQKSGFSDSQLIRFDSTDTVVIRNMNLFGKVTHNSAGALALVHCDFRGSSYSNTAAGTGKTFIEDCIAPVIRISGPNHQFWGRQLNTEHNTTEFQNDGATAWILGWKTEQQYNCLEAINGGATEIFGGHFFANNNASSSVPCLKIIDSNVSINFGVYQSAYPLLVDETVAGVTQQGLRGDMPTRGNGSSVPLFVAGDGVSSSSTSIGVSGEVTLGQDFSSYADQDLSGSTSVSPDGSSITLAGNNWKRFPINYTVTADTMLEFTVESSDTGEIIGVGLDENNDLSDAVRIFQVGGSQNWTGGQPISPSYTAGEGAVTYVIPVGSYYTGAMNWLVLAADDDANASTNVTYSNIKIYEAGGGGGNTLAITADSYVVSGSASSNYGSDSNLLVKDSDSNNFDRATYIKADVSSLGSDATQATLVLTVSGIGGESAVNRPVNLYALSNDSWSESAITWNNRPAKGNLLVSAMITSADVGNEIAFDVTDLINGERAGDGTVSFVLEQPGSANALVRFGSRESATPPVLEIGGGGGGGVPVTLAEYTFGSGSLASSDTDGESSASAVSSGGGSGYVLSAGEVSGRLRATTSDNNPNGNDAKLNNGQYAAFTITANSGKSLNIDSFSLGTRREGNSPDRLTVYASGDGGGSFVTVFENQYVPTSSAFATKDDLSLATVSELQGVSSVEFRIVYHAGSTGLTNGRDDTDDIEVIGSVAE